MFIYTISDTTNIQETDHVDNINIFCQFFIHSNKERQDEFLKCLKFNVKNEYITNIYLLNERIYSEEELDISSNKIIQVDIKNRLKFKDVFDYINGNNIQGYNVIINSDIFFDETIKRLFKSDIHLNKKMYALLRYEYDEIDINNSKIFGPRGDSQDTWIIHSNFSIGKKESKMFNFAFGKPGCDNKMTYLMTILGYEVLNDPEYIKTYHLHNTNIRNYTNNDKILPPYETVTPKNLLVQSQMFHKIDVNLLFNTKYNIKHGNVKLYEYISKKIDNNQNFIIPRVAGIETQDAIFTMLLSLPQYNDQQSQILDALENHKFRMKNNAGIMISSFDSHIKYSKLFLESFQECEIFLNWAPFDCVYQSCFTSMKILEELYKSKDTVYSEVLDIYHYIYAIPWTFALKGKRILMVSNFAESIEEKINVRKEIYGIDLFPDCEIITIRPPQTQGSEESEEFDIELNKFTEKLDKIKDNYDIALVSCGGYGNLVCSHIYKSGKSAIYVGGVLQMYWGILGNRWFENRPDVIRLFLNKHWSRGKDSEKPRDHKTIEGSCYW
jgi:hypothetical protein